MNPGLKFLSLLIVVAVLLGLGWYAYNSQKPEPIAKIVEEAKEDPNTENINGVLVTQANIAETGISKLPAGFPKSIPIEQANITESYRAVYPERGATQYTVSYTSNKSRDALWDAYSDYLKGEKYVIDTTSSSKSSGFITAAKDNDTLTVVISNRGGASLVQLSLLDRSQ